MTFFPADLGSDFLRVVKPLWEADLPDHLRLSNVWTMLSGLQGVVLSNLIARKIGNKVYDGPFRGMEMTPAALSGHFAPCLLGCYESELHEAIERVIAHPYKQILNIGSSYGYYSVGLARRMPDTKVFAYDINPHCQNNCKAMAEANGVADRVTVGGLFKGEDFERFAGPGTLVFMDIEGGEKELLDPERYPALRGMDVIVEMHDCMDPAISQTIADRFAASSLSYEKIDHNHRPVDLRKILGGSFTPTHFDGMIASWEGRVEPSPWAVIRSRPSPEAGS
ncbi:MAG: hypothetical protein PHY92_09060 [Alphaproteobacteria bacterium]|nr:hypothetical protein [Alphaproteobacteria bacterium]